MSEFQIAFIAMCAAAVFFGKPPVRVALAIGCNLALSIAISKTGIDDTAKLMWAGTLDAVTVLLLLGVNPRATFAALCYAGMVVAYPVGYWLDFGADTTYTCIEVLGVLALGCIGGVDRPIRRRLRSRGLAFGRPVSAGSGGSGLVAQRGAPAFFSGRSKRR